MASEKTQPPEQGTAPSASVKVDGGMSVVDFLTWEPADDLRYQLIDGVPVAMTLAGPTHATMRSRLASLLMTHLDAAGSPCTALAGAGVCLTAGASANVRIPDLLVTCSPLADVEESLIADPVLMIEILSPDNAVETWTSVWAYTTLASVQEILVLRTDAVVAHLLRRNEDGSWPPAPAPLGKDLELQSIGFAAPMLSAYCNTWLAQQVARLGAALAAMATGEDSDREEDSTPPGGRAQVAALRLQLRQRDDELAAAQARVAELEADSVGAREQ